MRDFQESMASHTRHECVLHSDGQTERQTAREALKMKSVTTFKQNFTYFVMDITYPHQAQVRVHHWIIVCGYFSFDRVTLVRIIALVTLYYEIYTMCVPSLSEESRDYQGILDSIYAFKQTDRMKHQQTFSPWLLSSDRDNLWTGSLGLDIVYHLRIRRGSVWMYFIISRYNMYLVSERLRYCNFLHRQHTLRVLTI